MRVRAVVLDMDGTITRFNLDYMGARRKVLLELEKAKLRTPEMTEQQSIYLMLKSLKQKLDEKTFADLQASFYVLLEEMEVNAAKDVELYPGAIEVLRKLRASPLRIGLVTNNGRTGTSLTLNRYNLTSFFDVIVTRDDCDEMKPDPGPVRKILEDLNASPEESIMVGDGTIDILAAKAAGVPSVAVATGPFSHDRLVQLSPDYILGSVNELPSLIEALNSEGSDKT